MRDNLDNSIRENEMPRAKKTDYSTEFNKAREISRRDSEDLNDCAVLALSLVTGEPYATVSAALSAYGRKKGQGTPNWMSRKYLKDSGFVLVRENIQNIIQTYPRPHCDVLKNFTTHHPRRFPGCVDPNKKYLAYTRGHVLAIIGGIVQDWSINSSLRVCKLYNVIKA